MNEMNSAETQNAPRDVLIEARALIARRGGWVQGGYNPEKGRYCMTGALWRVIGEYPVHHPAYALLGEVVGRSFLSGWNDEPIRRKSQVLRAFDEAIAKAPAHGVSGREGE